MNHQLQLTAAPEQAEFELLLSVRYIRKHSSPKYEVLWTRFQYFTHSDESLI